MIAAYIDPFGDLLAQGRQGGAGRRSRRTRSSRSRRRHGHDHRQESGNRTGHQDDAADADRRRARRRLERRHGRAGRSRSEVRRAVGRRQHRGAEQLDADAPDRRGRAADAAWPPRPQRGTCPKPSCTTASGTCDARASKPHRRLRRAGGEGRDDAAAGSGDGQAQGPDGLQDHRQAHAPAWTTDAIVTGKPLFGIDVDGAGHAVRRVSAMPGVRRQSASARISIEIKTLPGVEARVHRRAAPNRARIGDCRAASRSSRTAGGWRNQARKQLKVVWDEGADGGAQQRGFDEARPLEMAPKLPAQATRAGRRRGSGVRRAPPRWSKARTPIRS